MEGGVQGGPVRETCPAGTCLVQDVTDRLGPQGTHGPCHLPPTPWVGQRRRSWFLLGSLAEAGRSLKPPIRESPGKGAVNPGTREVPLPPALLTQLVAEPSPGPSPFP